MISVTRIALERLGRPSAFVDRAEKENEATRERPSEIIGVKYSVAQFPAFNDGIIRAGNIAFIILFAEPIDARNRTPLCHKRGLEYAVSIFTTSTPAPLTRTGDFSKIAPHRSPGTMPPLRLHRPWVRHQHEQRLPVRLGKKRRSQSAAVTRIFLFE